MPHSVQYRMFLILLFLSMLLPSCVPPLPPEEPLVTPPQHIPTASKEAAITIPQVTPVSTTVTVQPSATSIPTSDMPTATVASSPQPSSHYEPLSDTVCKELNALLSAQLDIPMEMTIAPFADFVLQVGGEGCLMTLQATGKDFPHMAIIDDGLREVLETTGWQEDILYAASAPGAILSGFTRYNDVCLTSVISEPVDMNLCNSDEPIAECWERLKPEQRLFIAAVHCAQRVP